MKAHTYPGIFTTFEGIEHAGKTQQLESTFNFFEKHGYKTIKTREPGAGPIGGQIRAILLDPINETLHPTAELMLYSADRAQHYNSLIIPHLKQGHAIVCDRNFDSTRAYQGHARNIDMSKIEQLITLSTENIRPDITFLIDITVDESYRRKTKLEDREFGNTDDRIENEERSFHKKLRKGYLTVAEQHPQRIKVIDGMQSIKQVTSQIYTHLEQLIKYN